MPQSIKHLLVAIALVQLASCATINPLKLKANKPVKATADNPVTRIICLWQPANGLGLDDLPTRGFAGQIVFLTSQSPTPVEVDGDVSVYLFDDQGPSEHRAKPLHDFRFVGGSWQTHLKQTTWGPTYQIFVPYVRKGDHRAACSLAVRLDPREGPHANSDVADIVLDGRAAGPGYVPTQVSRSQQSFPAGQVHGLDRHQAHGPSEVVPASRAEDRLDRPRADVEARHTQGFESFTIPYDAGKVPSGHTPFPQNR